MPATGLVEKLFSYRVSQKIFLIYRVMKGRLELLKISTLNIGLFYGKPCILLVTSPKQNQRQELCKTVFWVLICVSIDKLIKLTAPPINAPILKGKISSNLSYIIQVFGKLPKVQSSCCSILIVLTSSAHLQSSPFLLLAQSCDR